MPGSKLSVRVLVTMAVAALLPLLAAVPSGASFKYLKPGMEAADFSLRTLEGEELTFQRLRESPAVLLVFWATWSPKSEPALREAQALHEGFADKGLRVVAVNLDRPDLGARERAAIEKTVSDLGLTVAVAHDPGFAASSSCIGVVANPSLALFDSRGFLAWDGAGWSATVQTALHEQVNVLLGLGGPAPAAAPPGPVLEHKSLLNYNLGRSFLRQGNRDKAIALLESAVQADPVAAAPRTLLGHLLLERAGGRDTAQAETLFRAVLVNDPGDVSALTGLGDALLRTDRVTDAAAAFEKAGALDASFTPAIAGLALVHARQGQATKALALFAAALELNPRDAAMYAGRGACQEISGDVQAAVADYRQAVEILIGAR